TLIASHRFGTNLLSDLLHDLHGLGDEGIVKVSIVGVGMRNHSGIASTMFRVLSGEGINIMMISTSEIKVSCVIAEKYTELAVRALHTAFNLDQEHAPREETL
ncbi:MAG: ACT domain-containing protein, partial [Candidatus Electrothrix sp. AUS4]|nr:ACT domain-containing protein [Candidatus Electrothrix sp. AUS4]